MTDRRTASTITDTELDQLYAELAALRAVARGYCPHCGRGDAAPTVEDWEQQKQRADHLTTEITALRDDLYGVTGARWIADMLDTILNQPAPAATEATDNYEQTTGHEITCAAGFADVCTCDPKEQPGA
ncbi:hypothetical protein [Streptomyces spinosus]|uniref:hypothetical protein n=1 Tax=Streptomyces spinosus TaxID=2872623 RepID=UPI001CEDD2CE|nr:hypothetical protein [Streptomyces spinosus]